MSTPNETDWAAIAQKLHADCRKLERELAARQWQPIETAPKDGTEIIVWREDAGTFMARWIEPANFLTEKEIENWSEHDVWEPDWFYADFVSGGRLEPGPTHWTPLPQKA